MNRSDRIFAELLKPQLPSDDEYINPSDGLIYCKKCNTPRQTTIHVPWSDKPYHPHMMCRCESEELKRQEAEAKRRAEQEELKRLRSVGLQDIVLRSFTFENDCGYNLQIAKARKYVEHFDEMEKNGQGLLLWGDVGTGKTFMAGCIANALLDRGIPVLMTNFSRVLMRLTSNIAEDKNAFLDGLDAFRLLVIDDLGIERNTDFALEQVFSVIDRRCQSNKPVIITTNLNLDELKNPQDLPHARIYDRVLSHCIPIRVNGSNIRKLQAKEMLNSARSLLTES